MFRDIIIEAIKTTWRKKTLWLISILTIAPIVVANEWVTAEKTYFAVTKPAEHFILLSAFSDSLSDQGISVGVFIKTLLNQPIEGFASLLSFGVVLAIAIFFIWIVINAQAMMVMNVTQDKKNVKTTINQSLKESSSYWQNLAFLNIAYNLVRILVIALLLIILLKLSPNEIPIFYKLTAFTAGIALMAYSFITRFAIFHIILEKDTLKDAFIKGKKLFKKNIWFCYELSILIAIIIGVTFRGIEILLSLFFDADDFNLSTISLLLFGEGLLSFIMGLLIIGILLLAGGMVLLFQYSVWVRWFEKRDIGHRSYLGRIFGILKRTK